jgi:hypothetical protein
MLNLNIINKDPQDWDREDWQDAYDLYCVQNIYGPKTKREYYEMVMANFKKIAPQPISEELRSGWINGWKNAVVWAKKHKCNINGESLENSRLEINLESLQNDVREIQWQIANK